MRPIQSKRNRSPVHLLSEAKISVEQLVKDKLIEKLSFRTENSFISLIVVTAKRDGSVKLALNSKILNEQIYRNRSSSQRSSHN